MCFYITATLPNDTKIESLKEILDTYNMVFSPVNNNSIKPQLYPKELYLRATKDYCDCDTSLGLLNRSNEYQKLLNSKKVKALRKKKWTQNQINEWIQEKLKKIPQSQKKSITEAEKQQDIERWRDFILNMIKSVKRIGFLKHWYEGSIENEDIVIKRKEKVKIKDLSIDYLLNIEEDVLYEFYNFS